MTTDPQAAAAASRQPKPLFTIRPRRSWLPASPSELWRFRELMVRFAARDITLRYRQAVLGVVWVIVVPLLGAGILSFVFGGVASLKAPPGIPYFVFTLAGMVAWTAFSLIIVRASAVLVGNAQLVGKVYFPRLLLPLSTVLSTLVDVAVSLVLLIVLLVVTGVHPGPGVITLPIWFLAVIALALGGGLFFGALDGALPRHPVHRAGRHPVPALRQPGGLHAGVGAGPRPLLVRAEPLDRPARGHALVVDRHPSAVHPSWPPTPWCSRWPPWSWAWSCSVGWRGSSPMSSELAIRAEGLGKAYTISHQQHDHVTLAQVALDRAAHPLRRNEREQIWALRGRQLRGAPGRGARAHRTQRRGQVARCSSS